MPDAQPKPTAAEVIAAHYGSLWCPTCGPKSATRGDGGWRWDVAQHQVDMLAAAGLLVTAGHDWPAAEVPTTEQVRAEYVANRAIRVPTTVSPAAEFGRWLAEHDAQVAEKALRDAATDDADTVPIAVLATGIHARGITTMGLWFRADRIAAGGES